MDNSITIPNTPVIPGLRFRHFNGDQDYPAMAALITACTEADGLERSTTLEDIARNYRHLENCNTQTDMLMAEVNGKLIAYGRIFWDELSEGERLYHPFGFLDPVWRRKGIGTAMWNWGEQRVLEIAAGHPAGNPKFFQVEPFQSEKDLVSLLESRGYKPVRYEIHMVRDLSEPFPEAPMPPGLEVRPVQENQLRHIFEASNEAFRDHWGSRDESEEEYQSMLESPSFRPELWKVAWDGDQMASVVHNFIVEDENRDYHRKRGYTEGICTRRPWRKKGVARSLLVQSMQMFKEMGMTETALGADAENISGAVRLYEGVGYRTVKTQVVYRKPLDG
jgi:mycothiol synthase